MIKRLVLVHLFPGTLESGTVWTVLSGELEIEVNSMAVLPSFLPHTTLGQELLVVPGQAGDIIN